MFENEKEKHFSFIDGWKNLMNDWEKPLCFLFFIWVVFLLVGGWWKISFYFENWMKRRRKFLCWIGKCVILFFSIFFFLSFSISLQLRLNYFFFSLNFALLWKANKILILNETTFFSFFLSLCRPIWFKKPLQFKSTLLVECVKVVLI